MDSTICGLNKVICYAIGEEDEGKEVSISNGINEWKGVVVDGVAAFLIPSIPVPARKTYLVSFGDFSRDIQMGYGDIIEVTLADGYEDIVGADLLTLEQMNAEGAELKYKGVEATGIKEIYDDIQERTVFTKDETEYKFDFAVDELGRYGYVKDDKIVPFRTGQETLCYSLGQGRSFDIKAACTVIRDTYGIDLDYTKLTNANFIARAASASYSFTEKGHSNDADFSQTFTQNFTEPSIAYNPGTGTLTITNGTSYMYTDRVPPGGGSFRYYKTIDCPVNVYIVVIMNQN